MDIHSAAKIEKVKEIIYEVLTWKRDLTFFMYI